VATYKKVREFKPQSLKKYNTKDEWSASDKEGLVVSDVVYHLEDDPNCEAIEASELVSGYQYGKDLVPINKTMEFATRIIEEKCFKLLGFIGKEKIPRQVFMSNIDIVIPSENLASKKLFSAFIYSMLTLNRYAIARYIPRNLKNGVAPKLMLLIPHRSAKGECFYMTQLPTAEDIRDYQFTSLKESTARQQDLIENLVD
jgi:ATP-dependent DNA helicase 2 subunit 2